ncbi:MAG: hypothetical protein HY815_16270 [Candidatus Riflebacteria bacterium]|nr:hypothetical protein [Candidatus Riflebacteria bacterium]
MRRASTYLRHRTLAIGVLHLCLALAVLPLGVALLRVDYRASTLIMLTLAGLAAFFDGVRRLRIWGNPEATTVCPHALASELRLGALQAKEPILPDILILGTLAFALWGPFAGEYVDLTARSIVMVSLFAYVGTKVAVRGWCRRLERLAAMWKDDLMALAAANSPSQQQLTTTTRDQDTCFKPGPVQKT